MDIKDFLNNSDNISTINKTQGENKVNITGKEDDLLRLLSLYIFRECMASDRKNDIYISNINEAFSLSVHSYPDREFNNEYIRILIHLGEICNEFEVLIDNAGAGNITFNGVTVRTPIDYSTSNKSTELFRYYIDRGNFRTDNEFWGGFIERRINYDNMTIWKGNDISC